MREFRGLIRPTAFGVDIRASYTHASQPTRKPLNEKTLCRREERQKNLAGGEGKGDIMI